MRPLAWHRVPVVDRTAIAVELRTLKPICVRHVGFPHAAQSSRSSPRPRPTHQQVAGVTVYAITSLPFPRARPVRLADLLRDHWAIEALHHLRECHLAEDASQVAGAGPHVMACLRNLVIGTLS